MFYLEKKFSNLYLDNILEIIKYNIKVKLFFILAIS